MHELSEVKNIIDAIKARINNKKKVSAINIAINASSHIKESSFRKTFGVAVRGTILENARLNIKNMPVKVACKSCQRNFNVATPVLKCIYCKSDKLDVKLPEEELLVESVEVSD